MYALLTFVGRLLVTIDAKVYFVVGSSHLGAGAAAEAVVEILLIEVMRIPPPCLSPGASARGVSSSWGWIEKKSGRET